MTSWKFEIVPCKQKEWHASKFSLKLIGKAQLHCPGIGRNADDLVVLWVPLYCTVYDVLCERVRGVTVPQGLFLTIWKWGSIDKGLGGGVIMREAYIYLKNLSKRKNCIESGGFRLSTGGGGVFNPSPRVCTNITAVPRCKMLEGTISGYRHNNGQTNCKLKTLTIGITLR